MDPFGDGFIDRELRESSAGKFVAGSSFFAFTVCLTKNCVFKYDYHFEECFKKSLAISVKMCYDVDV